METTMEFHEINFSPFATNVLDCIGVTNLYTRTLRHVQIKQFNNFVVEIDGKSVFSSDDNVAVSYFLNSQGVGYLGERVVKA